MHTPTKTTVVTLLLILTTSISNTYAQKHTVEQLIKKSVQQYLSKNYISQTIKYNSYPNYTTTQTNESYSGTIIKSGDTHYAKIGNMEMISFKDYGLQINHDLKMVQVSKADQTNKQGVISILDYLVGFKSTLKETKDSYLCEFVPNTLTQIMLNKVIVKISKTDNTIQGQTLYFTEEKEIKNKKGELSYAQPRLEIQFIPRTGNEKTDTATVNKTNYITLKNNKIQLAPKFKGYELLQN